MGLHAIGEASLERLWEAFWKEFEPLAIEAYHHQHHWV
jgi:hypothetical protein